MIGIKSGLQLLNLGQGRTDKSPVTLNWVIFLNETDEDMHINVEL